MAKKYSPIHPGAFLSELLAELNITQAQLAREIGVSPMRISHVVKGAAPGHRIYRAAPGPELRSISAVLA